MKANELAIKQRYDRYGKLARIYESLAKLIGEMRAAGGMTAIDYEAIRADGGIKVSIEERVLTQIEKFESLKEDTLEEFFEIGCEIADGLKVLTDDEQLVIIYRHLLGTPWKELPDKIHCSERKASTLYAEAIAKISAAKGKDDDKTSDRR